MPHTDPSFADSLESYRHELQAHCYRMTGSFDEAGSAQEPAVE